MKKVLYVALCILIVFGSLITAFASDKYDYTFPDWADTENPTSQLNAKVYGNKNGSIEGMAVSIVNKEDFYYPSFMSESQLNQFVKKYETKKQKAYEDSGYTVVKYEAQNSELKKYENSDAIVIDFHVDIKKDGFEFEYYITLVQFSSKNRDYSFALTTYNGSEDYVKTDFLKSFDSFKIKEELPGAFERIKCNLVWFCIAIGVVLVVAVVVVIVILKKKKAEKAKLLKEAEEAVKAEPQQKTNTKKKKK